MVRFICAQPSELYFVWQVEVMLVNFIEMGIDLNYVDIVCTKKSGQIPEEWKKLSNGYGARFFFYEDTRKYKSYIPSVYFNLMKQHIVARPEIQNDVLFLHDCDIIFTKPISEWITKKMIEDDIWYGSDTRWYIAHSYIKSKGEDVLNKMCEIVDIDVKVIEDNEMNSIGAQYIIKNTTYEFWDKVENDSVKLYKYFCNEEPNYVKKHDGDYPIQKWTAGMWSLLWNAWYFGYETIIDKKMDFGWVTNSYSDVDKYSILHNSGVLNGNDGLFYKGNYIDKLPYNLNLKIKENTASKRYYEWVQKTEKKSVLLKNTLI
jgi:hypothetical protein